MTSFKEFARICDIIDHTSSSLEMTDHVAEMLQNVSCDELPIVTHFVMGEIFPAWSSKEVGIGTSLLYNSISKASGVSLKEIENLVRKTGDIGETAVQALGKKAKNQVTFSAFLEDTDHLSIMEIYERLEHIASASGKGSQNTKIKNLQYMFTSLSPEEARYFSRLAIEELRIGVGEGIVRDAIAKAFDVPVVDIERAFMLTNDFGLVAVAARRRGIEEVNKLDMQLNHPIKLMLAQITPSIETALTEMETAAIEWKFDGTRVQIHKDGEKVTIFSRRLENVTNSLPDIVKAVKEHVKADRTILDGETVAIDEDGRPRPFQEILKRFRRKYDVELTASEIPLKLYLFDIMYLDGENLIDQTLKERRKILESCVGNTDSIMVDKQVLTGDVEVTMEIYNEALSAGHEGIMIKNPESLYSPGKRGKNWLKKKPLMETLDFVVIGGEWGYGRRANFIGSYTLACHDPDTGEFLPVGKVATGINDEQLAELTERFSDLIIVESGRQIEFKPEVVFEIAFEEIQKSSNYESGYAFRFPRLVSVRDDKSPEEADTLARIEEVYSTQRK